MKNIILTGFMGTGKSTIGPLIAQILNRDFIDIDQYIAKITHMSHKEIYCFFGEQYFRLKEREASESLSNLKGQVISTGGGTLLNVDNYKLLKRESIVFCLNENPNLIWKRIGNSDEREILGSRNGRYDRMLELFKQRHSIYNNLGITINCRGRSPIFLAHYISSLALNILK